MNIAIWNSLRSGLQSNEFELPSIIYEQNPRCTVEVPQVVTRYSRKHVISLQFIRKGPIVNELV